MALLFGKLPPNGKRHWSLWVCRLFDYCVVHSLCEALVAVQPTQCFNGVVLSSRKLSTGDGLYRIHNPTNAHQSVSTGFHYYIMCDI